MKVRLLLHASGPLSQTSSSMAQATADPEASIGTGSWQQRQVMAREGESRGF